MAKKINLTDLFSRLGFILANLIAFLVFFIPYYVIEADNGDWEYAVLLFNKFSEFMLPAVAASVVLSQYRTGEVKAAVIRALLLALPRAIFLLPYQYLYFIAYGYDSIESISLSALVTVFGTALFFGQVLLFFFLAREVGRRVAVGALGGDKAKALSREELKEKKRKCDVSVFSKEGFGGILELGKPYIAALFSVAFLEFLIYLTVEIVDTVTYIVESEGLFFESEIIYIVISYLLLLAELFAVQAIGWLISRKKYNKTNIKAVSADKKETK